ncbi:MAG: hypothetical protein PX636_12120, partial [Microcystis sp. M53598_WE2]|uniref:hypothetical protein n=1 Tax=Microcystis sp. M53598_WE2 TaxID=3030677 RepID=UPI00258CF7E9
FYCKKKVFLTKSTKCDKKRTYFWLPVVIAEWELGRREKREGSRGIMNYELGRWVMGRWEVS